MSPRWWAVPGHSKIHWSYEHLRVGATGISWPLFCVQQGCSLPAHPPAISILQYLTVAAVRQAISSCCKGPRSLTPALTGVLDLQADKEPEDAITAAIQHLYTLLLRSPAAGAMRGVGAAEWWVHSRQLGQAHQLHRDMDERFLGLPPERFQLHHPVSTLRRPHAACTAGRWTRSQQPGHAHQLHRDMIARLLGALR